MISLNRPHLQHNDTSSVTLDHYTPTPPCIGPCDRSTGGSVLHAFISGGTSGLGLSLTRAFIAGGHRVSVCSIDTPSQVDPIMKQLHTEAKQHKAPPPQYFYVDLSLPAACEELVKKVLDYHPNGVDVLINNAGTQYVAPVETFGLDAWQSLLGVHLTAAFILIKGFLPSMRAHNWGRIINVASAHGLVASPQKSAYVAAKHGLVGLTKVVALETVNTNITCNALCPGWIQTPLVEKQLQKIAQSENISLQQATDRLLHQKHPHHDFVDVAALIGLCQVMCSDAGIALRGSALNIDCGWIAQ